MGNIRYSVSVKGVAHTRIKLHIEKVKKVEIKLKKANGIINKQHMENKVLTWKDTGALVKNTKNKTLVKTRSQLVKHLVADKPYAKYNEFGHGYHNSSKYTEGNYIYTKARAKLNIQLRKI